MLKFIICDDSEERIEKIKSHIKDFMQNHKNLKYDINCFSGYGKGFKKCVEEKGPFKIYLLDIKTKHGSGIDAARKIRKVYSDWTSIIIIETSLIEEKDSVLSSRLFIFDFIDKNNDYDNMLKEDLARIYKIYRYKDLMMPVYTKDKVAKIEQRDILYIEKDADRRTCKVHTLFGNEVTNEGIKKCKEYLTDDFLMTSRSAIVNLRKIQGYDCKLNEITFINGEKMNNISREYKKAIKEFIKDTPEKVKIKPELSETGS